MALSSFGNAKNARQNMSPRIEVVIPSNIYDLEMANTVITRNIG